MSKHTEGPWVYEYDNSDEGYGWWYELTGGPDSQPLISGLYNCPEERLTEAQANARLIAAAPDLLKAAQEALEFFENAEQWNGSAGVWAAESLTEAITKATKQD